MLAELYRGECPEEGGRCQPVTVQGVLTDPSPHSDHMPFEYRECLFWNFP